MWGVYYLAAFASGSTAFTAAAVAHFVIGYAIGSAIMARPLGIPLALIATACAGGLTRLALAMGTGEIFFAWAGPLAAIALGDTSRPRNIAYSTAAFVLGYLALSWLNP
jgi:hypothetical protein